ELGLEFATPAAVILMPYLHPSRASAIQTIEPLAATPPIVFYNYYDSYGNQCVRTSAPAGSVTFRTSVVVNDSGRSDPQWPNAYQHPVPDLPNEVLLFLLPSRYCEVDSELRDIAWS